MKGDRRSWKKTDKGPERSKSVEEFVEDNGLHADERFLPEKKAKSRPLTFETP